MWSWKEINNCNCENKLINWIIRFRKRWKSRSIVKRKISCSCWCDYVRLRAAVGELTWDYDIQMQEINLSGLKVLCWYLDSFEINYMWIFTDLFYDRWCVSAVFYRCHCIINYYLYNVLFQVRNNIRIYLK